MNGRIAPFLIATLLALTSCDNGNLFGKLHKSGDSSDPKTLDSDASVALTNKDYSRALDLYKEVLTKNPGDSVALDGAASAQMGLSGLNLGVLIANMLNTSGNASVSSVTGLSDFIAHSRERVSATSVPSGNSLLAGIDLNELSDDIDPAICRLQTIVSGGGDGVIKSNDPSVLINLGILCLIRAVLRPLHAGYFDVVNNGTSFELVNLKDLSGLCSTDAAILNQSGADVAAGYFLLNRAVTTLGLSSDRAITKLRDDIGTYGSELLSTGSPFLPQACLDTLNAPPANINATNFETKQDILTPPASSC